MSNDLKTVQKRLKMAYSKNGNWRAVGSEFRITGGMAYRIVMHDYEPKVSAIRQRLNLPAYAPAPCCSRCGIVHVSKRCTAKRQLPEPYESGVQFLLECLKKKARNKNDSTPIF